MELNRYGLARAEIPAAFNSGARSYDRLVAANPGYHHHLRWSAARLGLPAPGTGLNVLDLGCGTGASTAALLSVVPAARITAVDASAAMLAQAARKRWPDNVRFHHARMEDLAGTEVPRSPFDAVFAGYLIRNLDDPDGQLRMLRDLLRPGAPLAVHEYSVRDSVRARLTWHAVCFAVIIPAGKLSTGDATLYRHLHRSVLAFDGARQFEQRLRRSGFTRTRRATMTGWQRDVVHTFLAHAPNADPGTR